MGELSAEFTELQLLLDMHRPGNTAARELLVGWADRWQHARSRAMLRGFPGVARWEDADDVHNEALRRLNEGFPRRAISSSSRLAAVFNQPISSI